MQVLFAKVAEYRELVTQLDKNIALSSNITTDKSGDEPMRSASCLDTNLEKVITSFPVNFHHIP